MYHYHIFKSFLPPPPTQQKITSSQTHFRNLRVISLVFETHFWSETIETWKNFYWWGLFHIHTHRCLLVVDPHPIICVWFFHKLVVPHLLKRGFVVCIEKQVITFQRDIQSHLEKSPLNRTISIDHNQLAECKWCPAIYQRHDVKWGASHRLLALQNVYKICRTSNRWLTGSLIRTRYTHSKFNPKQ